MYTGVKDLIGISTDYCDSLEKGSGWSKYYHDGSVQKREESLGNKQNIV